MSDKLPPLELTEIEILHHIACEKTLRDEQSIRVQMRLHSKFPIGRALDKLISKGYIIYTDSEGNADDDGEFYTMSKSGKKWAEDTFVLYPW